MSLVDRTACVTPEKNTVNLGNIVRGDTTKTYTYVETYYDTSDTESETFEFSGAYDPELNRISFDSANKTISKLDSNGNISRTTEENVGSGALIFKDGIFFLNINDAKKQKEPIQFAKLDTSYDIKTNDSANGKVTVEKSTAYPGEFVIVKTEPDDGFTTQMVKVLDKDGKEIEVKRIGDNAFTFFMPEGDVEISATFVDSGNKKNDPSRGNSGYNGGSGSVTPAGTGDTNMLPLWIGIASAAAAVTLITFKRKRG